MKYCQPLTNSQKRNQSKTKTYNLIHFESDGTALYHMMTFINTNQSPIKFKTSKSTSALSMATCKALLINFATFYIQFYLSHEFIETSKRKKHRKINLDYNLKVTLNRFISNKLIKWLCCGRSYCPFYSWKST